MISQLIGWVRVHFLAADQLYHAVYEEERPEDHHGYWDCVRVVMVT